MTKSRVTGWLVVGIATTLLLTLGVIGIAQRDPLLRAAGIELEGGAPTIDPTVFVEPTLPPEPVVVPELAPPAQVLEPGPAPDASELQERLAALDTSEIIDPDGAPATLSYVVLDATSGDTLAARNPETSLIPASNTKTLTVLALVNAFEGNERFSTRVVAPDDDTIVLVGDGDPLLVSEPADPGTYPSPASLRELAEATAAALEADGRASVRLGFDDSAFEDDGWAPTWPSGYRDQVTQLSALWVDEGRVGGVRSRTPSLAAAQRFAGQLIELGISIEGEPAPMPGTGAELARVESLPVHVLAEQAMQRSNNSFTEVLGFQLARHTGHPTTFAGSTAAIEEQLRALGLWEDDAHIDDASGLSRSNHFSASMLARANLALVTEPRLTAVLDGLPVAGVTGTLGQRFTDPVARPARGVARAKTGSLSFVSSLAGTTTTADGARVVFAIMANGQAGNWLAKHWEDQVVGVITGCGC